MNADRTDRRKFERTRNSVRWIGLGALLLFLVYFTSATAVMSLSAHQLLHKINATEVNDQAVTTTQIREYVKDINTSEKPMNEAKKAFDLHNAKMREMRATFTAREQKLINSFKGDYFLELDRLRIRDTKDTQFIESHNADIETRKQALDPDPAATKARLDTDTQAYQDKRAAFEKRSAELKQLEALVDPDDEQYYDELQAAIAAHRKDREALAEEGRALNARKTAYQAEMDSRKKLNADIKAFNSEKDSRRAAREDLDVSDFVTQINALRSAQQTYEKQANCTAIKLANRYHEEARRHIARYNSIVARYGFQAPVMTAEIDGSNTKHTARPVRTPASETDCPEAYEEPGNLEMVMVAPKVQGLIEDFEYFNNIHVIPDFSDFSRGPLKWLRIWEWIEFAKMPMEYLTILLVLCMGMLGGTIRLTRIYLRNEDNENYASYFFFPLMGAVTAFAVYVLAKAGVLIISDTGSGGGGLSPYFISFIGLVSGMLADNALDTIQNLGGNWFKEPPAGPERWAMCLNEKCGAVHEILTVDEIADLTGYQKETAQAWLDEVKPVPFEAQKLISARLNTPIRELFSDIPPRRMAADAMGGTEPDVATN